MQCCLYIVKTGKIVLFKLLKVCLYCCMQFICTL